MDPESKRVYTVGMIEKALDQLSGQGSGPQRQEEGKGSGTQTQTQTQTSGREDGEQQSKEKEKEKGKGREMPTWTGVVTTRSAKSQALDAMKALIAWQPIPVARARMRLRITCPTGILKQPVKAAPRSKADAEGADEKAKGTGTVKDHILSFVEQVEKQDVVGEEWEVTGFVEPGAFKGLGEFVGGETKGRGRVEVLDMAVTHEGD